MSPPGRRRPRPAPPRGFCVCTHGAGGGASARRRGGGAAARGRGRAFPPLCVIGWRAAWGGAARAGGQPRRQPSFNCVRSRRRRRRRRLPPAELQPKEKQGGKFACAAAAPDRDPLAAGAGRAPAGRGAAGRGPAPPPAGRTNFLAQTRRRGARFRLPAAGRPASASADSSPGRAAFAGGIAPAAPGGTPDLPSARAGRAAAAPAPRFRAGRAWKPAPLPTRGPAALPPPRSCC